MPHAFAVYPSRRFVYCLLWGDIAAIDIVTLRQSLAADPRFDPTYAMLVACNLWPADGSAVYGWQALCFRFDFDVVPLRDRGTPETIRA